MVSRILQGMGLFMGDRLSPGKHEDLHLNKAVVSGNLDHFATLARDRDLRFDKWGFKSPKLRKDLRFLRLLRAPRLIVMFRDPLAISLRNELSSDAEFEENFAGVAINISKLASSLEKIRHPMLLISYEKALQYREETVASIIRFCGLSPSPEAIDKAVASIRNGDPRYLSRGTAQATQTTPDRLRL
jgi:hypothetical protein